MSGRESRRRALTAPSLARPKPEAKPPRAARALDGGAQRAGDGEATTGRAAPRLRQKRPLRGALSRAEPKPRFRRSARALTSLNNEGGGSWGNRRFPHGISVAPVEIAGAIDGPET